MWNVRDWTRVSLCRASALSAPMFYHWGSEIQIFYTTKLRIMQWLVNRFKVSWSFTRFVNLSRFSFLYNSLFFFFLLCHPDSVLVGDSELFTTVLGGSCSGGNQIPVSIRTSPCSCNRCHFSDSSWVCFRSYQLCSEFTPASPQGSFLGVLDSIPTSFCPRKLRA